MKYVGSKNRVAKHILPIMLAARQPGQWWVEPFVGGANLIDKVDGNRLGNDAHVYLIALLRAVQDGWVPPTEVSRELYQDVKRNSWAYPQRLVGFVGFPCSFGGVWLSGYANAKGRSFAAESNRNLTKQSKNLKGIIFKCGSYLGLEIPSNSLIYCDPPYGGTTPYKGADKFDHDVFWQWCRDKSAEGHTVFVSEYKAPDDFACVREVEHNSTVQVGPHQKRIERLFVHSSFF